jgi:hypothetical protein
MTLEERVETLERELNRANRRNRRLIMGVAVCISMAAVAWAFTPQVLLAQNAAKTPNVIRANAFVLEDEKGRVRAKLDLVASGPRLVMSDENGKLRAALAAFKSGPRLVLSDEKGGTIWQTP